MSTKTDPTIFESNGHKLVWGDALQVLDGAVADASCCFGSVASASVLQAGKVGCF